MDAQYNQPNNKAQVSFYRHQTPQLYCDDISFRSSLYRYRSQHDQIPLNFIGRRTIRAPLEDVGVYNPAPLNGVRRAPDHMPIMRTMPIRPKFQ